MLDAFCVGPGCWGLEHTVIEGNVVGLQIMTIAQVYRECCDALDGTICSWQVTVKLHSCEILVRRRSLTRPGVAKTVAC